MNYKLVTNFPKEVLPRMARCLKAVGIEDWVFCETARDVWGREMPEYYALYRPEQYSPRTVELFWQCVIYAEAKDKEMAVMS